jgi:dTDP-4-amino-4,6-dideoxygalactose transaminase
VITVANTFFATVEAIFATGARPVFADILPNGHNIDPDDVQRRITARTRAIIPVHLYGEMAPMGDLMALAHKHGLRVLEDACQAHGARLNGQSAGTIGDAGCFSFYPTKNLGAVGEGGMVVTDHAATAQRIRELRDHGQAERHNHAAFGFNRRMSELQAAALRVALPHLEGWNLLRAEAARRYLRNLAATSLALPQPPTESSVFHLFVVEDERRDALRSHLTERGIDTAIHYPTPIHLQPAAAGLGFARGSLPHTEERVSRILSLPFHPGITTQEIDAVTDAVLSFKRGHRAAFVEAAR